MTVIAGLDAGQQTKIADLLGRCVVQIQAGRTKGTGFFIAPRQVLTCRHVVASALAPRNDPISVRWFPAGGGTSRQLDATILEASGEWPDVAILTVPEATDCPCVILDAGDVLVETPLLAAGYPDKATMEFQPQRFTAGFRAHSEGEARELRIEGNLVSDGISGSPIVNLQSGLVMGIVRITKSSSAALGGFGTLFADILDKVPSLQLLVDQPPQAVAPWIKVIGATTLKVVSDRDPKGARYARKSAMPRIDLTVEQDAASAGGWHIGVRSTQADIVISRSAADLGDGVLSAVDGWSRRQAITRDEEVKTLGEVLERALIPGEARTAVDYDRAAPPFLLRVRVDRAGGLSQLPWEYAWGDDAVPLSVSEDMAFVRFVDAPGSPPPARDQLRVLAITEFPAFESAQFREYEDETGRSIQPRRQEFEGTISQTFVDTRRITLELAPNLPSADLRDKLAAERWDVVHYIGFAWAMAGRIVISMGCGNRSTFNPVPINVLRDDYLAPSGCSVFVAEFHPPPLGWDLGPPADPGAFTALLQGDLHAVVVTQAPVDLADLGRFNDSFYERIGQGDIVELAVQAGRCAVRNGMRRGRDVTAFGAFTVTTRQAGEVRLLQPRASAPGLGRTGAPETAAAGMTAAHGPDTAPGVGTGD